MARSRIQTADGETSPKQPIPDLNALVTKKRDDRQAELAAMAGIEPEPAITAEPAAPAAAPTPRDYNAEIGKLDQELVKHIAQSAYNDYDSRLTSEFGNMLPLIAESRTNPTLRKNLELLGQDQELRAILADDTAPTRLRKSADKKLAKLYEDEDFAEFVATQALPIWEENNPAGARTTAQPQRSPEMEAIERIEKRQRETEDANDYKGYISTRGAEKQALVTAFPQLAKATNIVARVVGDAERDFQARAAYAGIDTSDNNRYWAAQARRQGIQPPSYHDYYKRIESEYQEYSKVIPVAAPTGAPGDAQQTRVVPNSAPRGAVKTGAKTKAELRERGVQALAKLQAAKKG